MNDAVIVSGARTPVGRFGGAFKDVSAPDLGAIAIKAAIERAGISPDMVDEVVLGNAIQAAEAGYAARLASLKSGIPHETPTIAVNRQCSSGLEAINMAAQLVRTGEAEIVVAGGTENMSQVPFLIEYRARFDGLRMGNSQLVDGLTEGLGCPVNRYHMGVTAENVAERFSVSRSDQDELALISHHRASSAITQGRFSDQITEVSVPQRRGDAVIITEDEGPRADTTIEGLANLRPVFKKDGTVTAGNSSGINDGAAALVLMSREQAEKKSLEPLAKIVSWATCGVEPSLMGLGPIPSIQEALSKANWKIDEVDLFEINEAFAAQSIAVIEELKIPEQKVNVNGGAIALGHPVGATGAIIMTKLVYELRKRKGKYGLATMCIGGGQGIAVIIEAL